MVVSNSAVSRSEVEKLRKELSDLRKAAGLPEPIKEQHPKEVYASATLIESMDRLHGVLDKLVKLFENANREIYDEYNKGLHDTDVKLERIATQNEKIARGVVALADAVKQSKQDRPQIPVQMMQRGPAQTVPSAGSDDDTPIPPPPKFDPAPVTPTQPPMQVAMPTSMGTANMYGSIVPLPNTPSARPALDEESFMRASVTPIATTAPQDRVQQPSASFASLPPLPSLQLGNVPVNGAASSFPQIQAPPLSTPNASPFSAQTPTAPTPLNVSRLPDMNPQQPPLQSYRSELPPPPPPPSATGRRSLLQKFSFK